MSKKLYLELTDKDAQALQFRQDQACEDYLSGLCEYGGGSEVEAELIAEERLEPFFADADKEYSCELRLQIYKDFREALEAVLEDYRAEKDAEWNATTEYVYKQYQDPGLRKAVAAALQSYFDLGRDLTDKQSCLEFVQWNFWKFEQA